MSDKYKDISDRSDSHSDDQYQQLDNERPVYKNPSMTEIVIKYAEHHFEGFLNDMNSRITFSS